MNGNGFDFSVVELSTLKLTPGHRVRLVVIDEISMYGLEHQNQLICIFERRIADDGKVGE
jgi:hypothetical protein